HLAARAALDSRLSEPGAPRRNAGLAVPYAADGARDRHWKEPDSFASGANDGAGGISGSGDFASARRRDVARRGDGVAARPECDRLGAGGGSGRLGVLPAVAPRAVLRGGAGDDRPWLLWSPFDSSSARANGNPVYFWVPLARRVAW